MRNETGSGNGVGFTGLLAIVFIVLKLTNNIDWSWWWVLSPIWIGFALAIPAILVLVAIKHRQESRAAAAENEFFRHNPNATRLEYALKQLKDRDKP